MNGSYYQNPTFPTNQEVSYQPQVSPPGNISSMNAIENEQSYIENILRMNIGKRANAYVTFADTANNSNKTFSGIIEAAGRDHLIMSDPENGNWYLIKLIYLDYVEFMERINYTYPYQDINY